MNTHNNIKYPYWIANFDNDEVVHYGKIEEGQNVTTNRVIVTFKNKQKWLEALEDFNIDTSEL